MSHLQELHWDIEIIVPNESRRIFKSVPRTIDRLEELSIQRGLSLSKWLRVDPAQVSNWRNYSPISVSKRAYRPIPREQIFVAMHQSCSEAKDLPILHDIENIIASLYRLSEKEDGSGSLFKLILESIQGLLELEHFQSQFQMLQTCLFFTSCAKHVLADICLSLEQGFVFDIFNKNNIGFALKYPANVFAGKIIHSNWMKSIAISKEITADRQYLKSLREQISKGLKKSQKTDEFCILHAIHMLSRYGNNDDRFYVENVIPKSIYGSSPLARHVMGTALSINDKSNETGLAFAAELLNDDSLCLASLSFDALHYGDSWLNGSSIERPKNYDRTLVNIARRVSSNADENLLMATAIKLTRILQLLPPVIGSVISQNKWVLNELGLFVDTFKAGSLVKDGLTSAARAHSLI